ncbi:unnamed protein product [Spirodela intermedia]|uniref:HSA domain-containing protein n=1 Tax=Spirodela intermedia TaxID=51605 RepID=A0A7I8KN99_SPIIN|nr:unnamed protein product [Spirodela intermedia]
MHGHSPGVSVVVNTEVDSMGGVVDVGLGVDTNGSPRRAAIEKAQTELRQEYYVREERKRELEFLEKGGNPLDFKFGSTASLSLQSTSVTDQQLDYDAKGSSAVATSPHGDSVDSCIRPGVTLGRDSNTADNLLLIDGQNSNHDGTKNEMRSGKRKAISSSEHSSKKDASNIKESEESGSFRLGAKSQAYARRNRSRPSRESVYVTSARSAPSIHNSKSLVFPSSCTDNRDKKDALLETQVEDNAVSSVSNSKPGSLCGNNVSRVLGTDDQVEMDVDAVEVNVTGGHTPEVDVGKGEAEGAIGNHLQQNDYSDRSPKAAEQHCPNGNSPLPSDSSMRESVSAGAAVELCMIDENVNNIDKSGSVSSNVVDLQNDNQISKRSDGQTVEEASVSIDIEREVSNPDVDHVFSVATECSAIPVDVSVSEKSDKENAEVHPFGGHEPRTVDSELVNSVIQVKIEEICDGKGVLSNEQHELTHNMEGKLENLSRDASNCDPSDVLGISEPSRLTSSKSSSAATDVLIIPEKNSKFSQKTREDAILKEARIIEAKLRRVNELSVCSFPLEKHQKSHWDYLLEEMAWLANDFIQERRWKVTAASQISHRIASRGWAKFEKQRKTACSLAKAVISFWELAEALHTGGKSIVGMDEELKSTLCVPLKSNKREAENKQDGETLEECPTQAAEVPILGYAIRFLGSNCVSERPVLAEAPVTPERICDSGVLGMPWEDQSSEESLFYVIPAGAMHVYRESIESRWLPHENTGHAMHREDYEASTCDSLAEYGSHENVFDEDEAETATHYFSGAFERSKSSKFAHRKKKTFQDKNHSARSFEVRSDLSYGPYLESKFGTQPSLMMGKRGSSTFNVSSIPTKRMRTASRQRVVSPFGVGNAGGLPVNSKTDVSSGDTSSFQDDQMSLHCESLTRKNAEIESTADFENKLIFDGNDVAIRSKKKKKQKHTGYRNLNSSDGLIISKASSYEHRWQNDPMAQNDQLAINFAVRLIDSFKVFSAALHGQYAAKKPKLLKQLPDASPETITPVSGSLPSPAASQMSSMSNTNKLIKMIASRDRSRKSKGLKMIGGQLGSGSSWSQFEDQALVVLVHDMGTNWELVSDTINSTLQFKGSARQLFQRLQGPMEEDTLKAHFEKIILIGRQLHFGRNQSESKETKLVTQIHSSHIHALTQACASSLTGSPLTPLDLAEVTQSSEALGHGYQGSHSTSSPMSTHPGSLAPIMTTSGANSMLPASAGLGMSSGLPSPSAPPIGTPRDSSRYGAPRPSLPVDDQQRMQQQYSQMLSGRNIQQPSMSGPSALTMGGDRGVRMLSGGNAMGMVCGVNNGMPISRPGFQGIGSPGMLNVVTSGTMLPVSGVGMSSPVNMHSNAVAGQGNSLLRPRDHLQVQRPPQNPEDHKQMMMQDIQLQSPPGGACQPVGPMNSMSGSFPSPGAATAPSIQTFSPQQPHQMPQQPHLFGNTHHPQINSPGPMTSPHPAYAMRFAKERQQLQQRLLHQQHFSGSNAGAPPQGGGPQMQQQQPPPQPSPGSPATAQHKPQSNPRNPTTHGGGMPGQMLNQRQRQHLQQQQQQQQQTLPPRHQQQRQQNERVLLQQGQGLFSGGSGSGAAAALAQSPVQQKMYPRPPSRPLGSMPPAPPHQEASPLHNQQQQHQQQRQGNHPQQAMQRMMLQQNHHVNSEGPVPSGADQVQVNPTVGTSPVLQGSDPGAASSAPAPASGPVSHWKSEPSYETTTPAPPGVHLSSPQKQTLVGGEAAVLPSGQGLTKRSFPGGLPMNVHGVGGQWQQQKHAQQQPSQDQPQQQQQQQQQPPPPPVPPQHQQQHRQPVQSGLYGTPSNPGPI